MTLQQVRRFYILLESNCCIFVAYYHEFRNRESYNDLFYLFKENFKISYLTHQSREGGSRFVLFTKLFVFTKMEVQKNMLQRIPRH